MSLDSINPDTAAAVAAVPPIEPNTREDAEGTFHDVIHELELNAIAELQGFADAATVIINDHDARIVVLEEAGPGAAIGRTLEATFDAGSVDAVPLSVTVGAVVTTRTPYALTLTGWTLLLDGATGDVSVEVRIKPFASGSWASITGGSAPSASGGANAEGDVTGWTVSIPAGDLVEFSIATRTGVVPRVSLKVQATQA
jgi:hypothetical protein